MSDVTGRLCRANCVLGGEPCRDFLTWAEVSGPTTQISLLPFPMQLDVLVLSLSRPGAWFHQTKKPTSWPLRGFDLDSETRGKQKSTWKRVRARQSMSKPRQHPFGDSDLWFAELGRLPKYRFTTKPPGTFCQERGHFVRRFFGFLFLSFFVVGLGHPSQQRGVGWRLSGRVRQVTLGKRGSSLVSHWALRECAVGGGIAPGHGCSTGGEEGGNEVILMVTPRFDYAGKKAKMA